MLEELLPQFLLSTAPPFFLSAGLIVRTSGNLRKLGVAGVLVLPIVLNVLFWVTAPDVPEGEDNWGWVFAMVGLAYLGAAWFVSALAGCLAGALVLKLRSRAAKAEKD